MSANDANPERETQLLAIGRQCSETSCLLVDFLPLKCNLCSASFCEEHFAVAAHKCPKYDDRIHNRVAPSCPLCNTPVAIPPGEDPNIRMERHISNECSVTTGKSARPKSTPVCARGKCGKVLFAPIACDACHKNYCPQHRFQKDHGCIPSSTHTSTATHQNVLVAALKRMNAAPSSPSKVTTKATLTGQGSNAPPDASSSKVSPLLSNPLSKTDRRARAERESRRKAMMERAKKGLLTEQEKLILAAEEAERAQGVRSSDKECVVM
ncbi:hypothetical protein EDD17DRAFT_1470561 [Pisolithus thermaeus]|nr:hypothetical protein EV401DRAFT_1851948 [Pisolithus croceorrhizus]KAI6166619.1 hypothetical protein EDD17DRAFT_1470561 [Pisolithus thermaeus]